MHCCSSIPAVEHQSRKIAMDGGLWRLSQMVMEGAVIVWVGVERMVDGEDKVLTPFISVRVLIGRSTNRWLLIRIEELLWADEHFDDITMRLESDEPGTKVGTIWSHDSWLDMLRLAAINGVTVCSYVTMGRSEYKPIGVQMCVMGYDLEVILPDMEYPPLPLPRDEVLCGTLWCSCGYRKCFHTVGVFTLSTRMHTTGHLLMAMVKAIESHAPLWLVGYNCYVFDNAFFAYHLPRGTRDRYVQPIRLAKSFGNSLASVLTIAGVNNIDLYVYVEATLRSSFTSLLLDAVATELGLPSKLFMPSLHVGALDDIGLMVRYCMRDSELASLIYSKLGMTERMCSMACACRCALIDVVKYSTGIMSACILSSYSLAEAKLMD